jgi:hypothetical protein
MVYNSNILKLNLFHVFKKDKNNITFMNTNCLPPMPWEVRVRRNKIIIMFNVICRRRNNMLDEPTLDKENTHFNLHHA